MNHKPRCETDQSFLQVEYLCSLSGKGNERNNELSVSNERPEAKRTFTLTHSVELKQKSQA